MTTSARDDEGGLLPLGILLALLLCILGYGIQQGFLNRHDPDADKQIHLTIVVQPDSHDSYRKVVERFKRKHPQVGVRVLTVSGAKYYQKLLVMMASGNPPDLMWMGQGFGEFAQRGTFLDVGDRIRRDVDVDRFLPVALEWYRSGERQLGIPFRVDADFILYNKDIFDQAGLAYPSNDWDYARFFELADRLTLRDERGRTIRYGYFGMLDDCLFDAQFISDDGTHATCDSPQMIRAVEVNDALINQYHIAPSIQQRTSLDRHFLFASGRAAMMQAYTWDLTSLRQQAGSVRWGYVLNPKVTVRAQWASSQAMLISSSTRHPEMAWQLCREFFSPEFQAAMAVNGLPSDLEVARQLAESGDPEYDHLPILLKARDRLVAPPRVAHFSEASQLVDTARESVWTGQQSAAAAMQWAARLMDRMLKQQRRYGS